MSDLSNDIERYRKNRMTDAERHALEKKALVDPFLADALEGAETVETNQFSSDVDSLNKRLTSSRKPGYAFTLRLAAGFAIIVTAGWLFWRTPATETIPEQLTKNVDPTAGASGDTTQQLLTLSAPAKPAEEEQQEAKTKKDPAPASATSPAAGPSVSQPATETVEDLKEDASTKDDRAIASEARRLAEAPRVVTGKVTEAESGVVLPGAVIRDPGSQNETRAAADGSFSLRVASDSATLQYSYPGLQTLEKTAGNAANNVALRDDSRQRSEIIVFPSSSAASRQERSAAPSLAKRAETSGEREAITLAVPANGLEAYQQYLEQNQRIPETARRSNVHGKVTVSFTVDRTGALKDLTVLKSVGAGCDEELIRLIQQGPSWSPSKEGGRPVSSTVWVKLDF